MKFLSVVATATTTAALAATAVAVAQPSPATTSTASTGPGQCSATAFGPTITSGVHGVIQYGGGTSCAGAYQNLTLKTISAQLQILGPDHKTWHTRSSTALVSGFATQRVSGQEAIQRGRKFRVVANVVLLEPNGHAGCSMEPPFYCNQPVAAVAISKVLTT
jgi:hypothetical protein